MAKHKLKKASTDFQTTNLATASGTRPTATIQPSLVQNPLFQQGPYGFQVSALYQFFIVTDALAKESSVVKNPFEGIYFISDISVLSYNI